MSAEGRDVDSRLGGQGMQDSAVPNHGEVVAKGESACMRCGRSDGPLKAQHANESVFVCSYEDREASAACWQKFGPHCPSWCTREHPDADTALRFGNWLHSSEPITISVATENGLMPETYRVALYACEAIGGPLTDTTLHVDQMIREGRFQDNMVMSASHAENLTSVLKTTAKLALM